jgi:hypothetical protein
MAVGMEASSLVVALLIVGGVGTVVWPQLCNRKNTKKSLPASEIPKSPTFSDHDVHLLSSALAGTSLHSAMAEVTAADAALDDAKRAVSVAKKRLSQTMHA